MELLEYRLFDFSIGRIFFAAIIFLLFLTLKGFFVKYIFGFIQKIAKKFQIDSKEQEIDSFKKPIGIIFIAAGLYFAKDILQPKTFDGFFAHTINSIFLFALFWLLYNLIDKFENIVTKFFEKLGEISKDIENFLIKTIKVLIFITGFLSILQEWGINVGALVASLGLGGLAFALAAKDTAANLFGSLIIFIDRPFKVGDWIKMKDVEGNVEEIGIRSTKIRTFDHTLVSVPNSQVSNESIVNWSMMQKRRIKTRIGLTYSTTPPTMERILENIRQMLKEHPNIHQETIFIYFDEFTDSSLSIFCNFFTIPTATADYFATREDVNLKIMKIIEEAGASFAFPSQSIYIEKTGN